MLGELDFEAVRLLRPGPDLKLRSLVLSYWGVVKLELLGFGLYEDQQRQVWESSS